MAVSVYKNGHIFVPPLFGRPHQQKLQHPLHQTGYPRYRYLQTYAKYKKGGNAVNNGSASGAYVVNNSFCIQVK